MLTKMILSTHPADLIKKLDELFKGESWYSWEPEVLLTMLKEVLSDASKDKVLAVQAVACNVEPVLYKAFAFENVVHSFCNNFIVPDVMQPVSVEEIMYAVPQIIAIANHVHGKPVSFTGEIPQYVAAAAKYSGWVVLPPRLSFAQECLDSITGMFPGSKRYLEFKHVLDMISRLAVQLDATNLDDFPEVTTLLEEDTDVAIITRRVLGAYLFDPTKYGN